MQYLSVFQLLPSHAVKMIVDHLAGDSEGRTGGMISDTYEYRTRLFPLLSVCHNFRVLVHALLCDYFCISVDFEFHQTGNLLWTSQSLEPTYPGYPSHHLAKKLELCLDLWAIYTGRAFERISSSPYDGCSFPLVREIKFWFVTDNDEYGAYDTSDDDDDDDDGEFPGLSRYSNPQMRQTPYPPDTLVNIAAFIQRVKEMAPNIRTVVVDTEEEDYLLLGPLSEYAADLTQQLYDIAETKPTTITRRFAVLVEYLNLDPIRNLVHVDYHTNNPSSPILSLIRRNAQTLHHVDLDALAARLLTGFIRDPDGDRVEYPCLHTLKLAIRVMSKHPQNRVVGTAVLFPSLRHLTIANDYPFNDDVLFRGNAATLEFLDIELNLRVVAILRRHNVFTPTSHPKLQCVKTRHDFEEMRKDLVTSAEYLQSALTIAPDASVRAIAELAGIDEEELGAICSYANIQVLSLPNTHVTIWDVMTIIKSLPLLSHLTTWPPVLGSHPQGVVTANELPKYVRSTYTSIGWRFRCWHFRFDLGQPFNETATCLLLLALVCPSFDLLSNRDLRSPRFIKKMKKLIDKPGFQQDAPRLLRLLSN
ncbi:hypothetical protein IWW38_003555 [Coemansia aciculifera]|uniref:Uncharacterized protein n=1 Tax=Coemansia aciculifera TaxID=417176 RepID=A0ACC1M0G2_9FUNG|nr:hypothetical protein IWW38_003555 [Coemansia aciculifera]